MRRSPTIVLVLAASMLPGMSGLHAQAAAPRPPVRLVLVYDGDTQEPIDGADVTDLVTKNRVKTSATGTAGLFVPEFVKADGAVLKVTKVGYVPSDAVVVNDPFAKESILVPLTKQSTVLPAVITTEKYRLSTDAGLRDGFARRCSVSTVTCFADSTLAAHPSSRLIDFLVKTSGVLRDCGGVMNRGARSRRQTGAGGRTLDCVSMRGVGVAANKLCQPTYYVDGFVRGNGKTTLDDIEESLGPLEVQGIEVYNSGEPMSQRLSPTAGNEGCGIVAIWTK